MAGIISSSQSGRRRIEAVSDWLDAARGRFEFLRRVAELRGAKVRFVEAGQWKRQACRRVKPLRGAD